ncbi:MAG: hypothetical protein D6820_05865 [Lentisphaerae bacterium]|nr:MAG: hypothetical protein D6820_05865 [Lentisphaerota bacterium]
MWTQSPSPGWRIFRFSLLEVMFALTIVIVGVTAIFGLMPVGSSAHRDAIHLNNVSDSAEEILNIAALTLHNNWNAMVNLLPTQPVDIGNGSDNGVRSGATLDINESGSRWRELNSTMYPGIYYYDENNNSAPFSNSNEWVFRVLYRRNIPLLGNPAKTKSITDVDAVCRIWWTPVQGWVWDESVPGFVLTSVPKERAVNLHVEVSWPASIRYRDRQKKYFTLEVVRK